MFMWKWLSRFFALGVIVATVLALLFMLENKNYVTWSIPERVYLWLWPSCILFVGTGDKWWLYLIWDALSIVVNGFIYAIPGACVGAVSESRNAKPH